MSCDLLRKLELIDAEKTALELARPLPKNTIASLREKLALDWTYHSNAIEGNTLTLRETKVVLEGITVGGKSIREHCEAINHRDAIFYIEEIVSNADPLNEWLIKNLHGLVLANISNDDAGRYRRQNVVIAGARTIPPDHLHLNDEMRQLMEWYQSEEAAQLHVIERATELHTRFVKIHPFEDGNGRTGRLLLNFELMREGYPPAVIKKEDRLAYYDALEVACLDNDYSLITELVADAAQDSLAIYVDVLGLTPHYQSGTCREPVAKMK